MHRSRRATLAIVVVPLVFANAITSAACRAKKELAPAEACKRIEPFRSPLLDGGWKEADREGCLEQWRTLTASSRQCASRCLDDSKSARDYDECLDDCAGNELTALGICLRAVPDGSPADSDCIVRLNDVKDHRPAAFNCVSRCVRRAPDPTNTTIKSCESTCGLR